MGTRSGPSCSPTGDASCWSSARAGACARSRSRTRTPPAGSSPGWRRTTGTRMRRSPRQRLSCGSPASRSTGPGRMPASSRGACPCPPIPSSVSAAGSTRRACRPPPPQRPPCDGRPRAGSRRHRSMKIPCRAGGSCSVPPRWPTRCARGFGTPGPRSSRWGPRIRKRRARRDRSSRPVPKRSTSCSLLREATNRRPPGSSTSPRTTANATSSRSRPCCVCSLGDAFAGRCGWWWPPGTHCPSPASGWHRIVRCSWAWSRPRAPSCPSSTPGSSTPGKLVAPSSPASWSGKRGHPRPSPPPSP